MTRPVALLGMNNPKGTEEGYALYPLPKGSAGDRLFRLASARSGATRSGYIRRFVRTNLINQTSWHAPMAVQAGVWARRFFTSSPWEVLILGAEVRKALGFKEEDLTIARPWVDRVSVFRYLPHPSGRNRWFNDPANKLYAELLMAELYERAVAHHKETET